MKVISEVTIPKSAEEVWGLLLNSNVDQTIYCPIFCLGVPRPVRCEHNIGDIVGERKRRCVSDRGTIEQEIDLFEPHKRLSFHLVKTDLSVKSCLSSMSDSFLLSSDPNGTKVRRETEVNVLGWGRWLKLIMIWFGIKSVHRYVFKAWRRGGA